MVCTQIQEEKEGNERGKRKVIYGQTESNHHTRAIQRGRGCRDESNDAAKAPVQPPESVARAA